MLFLDVCRYFPRRTVPPEIAEIVQRHAAPVVRNLRRAAKLAEHGDAVVYEGREHMWEARRWDPLPLEQSAAVHRSG